MEDGGVFTNQELVHLVLNTLLKIIALAILLLSVACAPPEQRFKRILAAESGITFRNDLKESVDFNLFNYMYFYNGAGVGVGDFNGDSFADIYFTSNQEANKLYLNRQHFVFEDVTKLAGVEGEAGWKTGVSVADVNADGRLDIYVSYVGQYLHYKGRNQLFINEGNTAEGIPLFTEKAEEYGLDLVGFSTQAVFFDYDRDGDLDMFMLNHSLHQNGTFGNSSLRNISHPLAGDKLFRNEHGRFRDVTPESRIFSSVIGYGLGVTTSDVNMDGWLDIYVGNDFHENDYLYINQRDGTFKDIVEMAMPHTSRYTMGVDFADFNNDAFPDLIAMDMLPSDPKILKASQAEEPYDVNEFKLNFGYNHQFARNVLQLNNQDGTFSDIALKAGVSATDWSWSTLFADFDLDGQKDIYVSNGIFRRSNDLDYINFITADSIQAKLKTKIGERELEYIHQMPQIKIPNALFLNNGDSTFTDMAKNWGLEASSYSNGTAYADFDNDGDLDIVVNNIEDEAFLYQNLFRDDKRKQESNHFIQFSLRGSQQNTFGIGAKVFVYQQGELQVQECIPVRGYLSSVDYKLTFGLGPHAKIDSVVVIWPDGISKVYASLPVDKHHIIKQADANQQFSYDRFHNIRQLLFKDTSQIIPYTHRENRFVEFNREQLIPHMFSEEGPAVALADVNRDGLEDVYLGGSKWQSGSMFIQTTDGKFMSKYQPVFREDSTYEDVDAIFFDADNDSDQDLFVVSGGDEFRGKSIYRSPRLYLNDGGGRFSRSNGLPEIFLVGSCVASCDIDQDGDVDLFIGARTTTSKYGIKPDSYILSNDGHGKFRDITDAWAPALRGFGFIKSATWADVVGDTEAELILASEWMPISVLTKRDGKFELLSPDELGLAGTSGWWNVVKVNDLDNDGDLDLIAGNLGQNSKLKASMTWPVHMYVADFDKNDQLDQVLTHFINAEEYPFNTRDEMTKQMPFLKKRFLSYKTYAQATVLDIFGNDLKVAQKYTAQEFRSCIFRNENRQRFSMEPLPGAAQLSTVNAIEKGDFNGDGFVDFVLGGNFYPINIQMGRNDASYGILLQNTGNGRFVAVPSIRSGLSVTGQVRQIKLIQVGQSLFYLMIRNNDRVEVFKVNQK